MVNHDDEILKLRRLAIFKAGAEAAEPKPLFQGRILGSSESCNFFDGYASTHPGFVNPYRRRP